MQTYTYAHKVKRQYEHCRLHTKCIVLPWKIPKEISRWSMLFNNKGSIYHIKHMYIQSFTIEVDWPEVGYLIEVFNMFDTCTNYIFYFLQQTTSNPLKTTCRLVKMRIWSSIESITECVRKNSLKCKFLMYCYQTCFMIGLTNDHIMILTNHIWCYKASSAHGVNVMTTG